LQQIQAYDDEEDVDIEVWDPGDVYREHVYKKGRDADSYEDVEGFGHDNKVRITRSVIGRYMEDVWGRANSVPRPSRLRYTENRMNCLSVLIVGGKEGVERLPIFPRCLLILLKSPFSCTQGYFC